MKLNVEGMQTKAQALLRFFGVLGLSTCVLFVPVVCIATQDGTPSTGCSYPCFGRLSFVLSASGHPSD